ncbi:hypothetical protein RclHR1_00870012 [Rhizophagus clarus]|uniref:Uncharacterized protein n=1 Tax=Rhizophagus clarus TaxID=94130 RepID=A0A2Z6S442_9GLOM|nr:hypothetical protein RclHR1_00870012 [Rhizophagus clarus]
MELVRNNNELNKKFTGEITKINSRDAGYVDFDQLSVANHSSSSESSSSRLSDSSLEENRNHFKRVFDSNKEEGENLDYAFETVRRKIHQLTGEKIGKETVKNFYYGRGDPKFRIVMSIMRWVDSKEFNGSLDNNAE